MITFASYTTPEDYAKYIASREELFELFKVRNNTQESANKEHETRKKFNDLEESLIFKPFIKYIRDRFIAKEIKRPRFRAGYSTNLMYHLKQIFNPKVPIEEIPGWYAADILGDSRIMVSGANYQDFVSFIDKGDFRSYSHDCFKTNKKLIIASHNWSMKLMMYNSDKNATYENRWIPVPRAIDYDAIFQADINFPTGKLVVCDWIRADDCKLKEFCEPFDDACESINSAKGIIQTTMEYAKNGIVFVFAGNRGRDVVSKADELMVVDNCAEDLPKKVTEGWTLHGRTNSDLWWTTVIDVGTLSKIFGRKIETDEEIKSLFEEWDDYVIVNVPAGDYSLEFSHDGEVYSRIKKYSGRQFKPFFHLKPKKQKELQ